MGGTSESERRDSFTYQRLDVEALRGHDGGDVLFGEGLEDGGLSGVVEAENEDSGFLVVSFERPEEVEESHTDFLQLKIILN